MTINDRIKAKIEKGAQKVSTLFEQKLKETALKVELPK